HTLSYGQKQKVAIAGVLAMRPEIILLDEPTSPLDPDSETRLLDFLKKLNEEEKLTIVLTTFNLNRLAGFVDKLVFLDTGRVKASSAPADFFKDRNVLNNKNFSPPVVVELFWKMMDLKIIQGDGNKIPLTIGQLIDNLKERCNN
ncbi:MAG: ATP-binding cassette domain-containing protein, partial [Elusimicrobia bacterium]|nr:ATP-binding cassette domain-containing protein [Elusimicrobiota bacterium]